MKIELQNTAESFIISSDENQEVFEAMVFIDNRLHYIDWVLHYSIEDYAGSWEVPPTRDILIEEIDLQGVCNIDEVIEFDVDNQEELIEFLKEIKYEI